MAVSDKRRRVMPTALERQSGSKLGYAEAVRLTSSSNNGSKGEARFIFFISVEAGFT